MRKRLAMLLATMMLLPTTMVSAAEAENGFNLVDPNIEGEITIFTYNADSQLTLNEAAVAMMNEKYPNLTINLEHRSDSDGSTIKTWAAVGELPDIFEVTGADAYATLKNNGDLYPLDSAMEATGYYDHFINGEEVYKPAHIDPEDGKTYSFGNEATDVFVVYYNKSLFEELGLSEPTNFEEFKNCITTLKDAGKIPIALFGADQWPSMALYDMACVAEGEYRATNAINDDEASFDDEVFRNAAARFQEMVDLGAFGSGALSTNASQAFELEKTGQAGFICNGSWYWSTAETEGYADNLGWCNYNIFADAEDAEEVKDHRIGGGINLFNHSVNVNPPSGIDPEIIAYLALEFDYYIQVATGEAGLITCAAGDYEFSGSEEYTDYNNARSEFVSYTTWSSDMTDSNLSYNLGNAVEMIVSGNYTAEDFIEEMIAVGY